MKITNYIIITYLVNDNDNLKNNNPNCNKCNTNLTDDEFNYFQDNELVLYAGYLCNKHWCKCMPKNTPWKFLTECNLCGHMVCKTCKKESGFGCIMCNNCFLKFRNNY